MISSHISAFDFEHLLALSPSDGLGASHAPSTQSSSPTLLRVASTSLVMHHSVYFHRRSSPLFHSLLSYEASSTVISSSIASCGNSSSLLSVSIGMTHHEFQSSIHGIKSYVFSRLHYSLVVWFPSTNTLSAVPYFLRIISPHREQSIYCDFRSSFSATWIQSSTEVIFWIFITDISCLLFHLLQTLPFRVNEYLCGEMISHSCQRIQQ